VQVKEQLTVERRKLRKLEDLHKEEDFHVDLGRLKENMNRIEYMKTLKGGSRWEVFSSKGTLFVVHLTAKYINKFFASYDNPPLQIHKSYFINSKLAEYITRKDNKYIFVLSTGREIPIGPTFHEKLKHQYPKRRARADK
jgi:DNA-binding LytR/AlgR family response regulator